MCARYFLMVRFIAVGLLFWFSNLELFAQARLVLNGATINIANGGYLVIDNPSSNAITRNSGHIISEGENNKIQWNIGTTTGTYTIPWGYGAANYIPLSFTKTAGSGSGNFLFSTYHTGWQNSSQLPTGVSNLNGTLGTDNSAFASDRFWQMNAQGYATKPTLSNVVFTYLDAENNDPGNSITESGLIAKRYNGALSSWTDNILASSLNALNNTVTVTAVDVANFQPWWMLGTTGANRYWVAPANSTSNLSANWSAAAGGAGNAGVPTSIDAVIFDGTSDANCTLNADIIAANFLVNAGFTGTIAQGANAITLSNAATLAGGTFSGGSSDITVSGPFTLSGTSFTSTSGALDLKSNFTLSSGSFIHNGGTVRFSGTTSTTQNISGSAVVDFNNISITNTAANPGVSVESNQNLKGVLTLGSNVILDADGSSNNARFKLISLADGPTQDASIAPLPSGARVNGNVTVQRYMSIEGRSAGRIYRYISSPVQNASVADIQSEIPVTGSFTGTSICSGCGGNQSMFAYDETVITDTNLNGVADFNDGYVDFPSAANSETLRPGRGYTLFIRGNTMSTALWDVRGPINTGNVAAVSLPVTFNSSGAILNDGWNLVGNPFPSTIDWNAAGGWTKANLDGSVYISDNGSFTALQYTTWNGTTGTNGGTANIAMGQGFWVKATGPGAPVLQADENVKSSGTQTNFFRTAAPENLMRVTLVSGITRDETVIHFREDATELFDPYADAWKLANGTFNLSSRLANGNKLAINSLSPLNCRETTHLSVDNAAAGNYTLKFSEFESFPGNVAVSLFDKFSGTATDIRSISSYDFSVTADTSSYGANRFSLTFATPTPQSDFAVSTSDVCEGNGASIQISNSQTGASYTALSKGDSISVLVAGNGGVVSINIPADRLQLGQNSMSVQSVVPGCNAIVEKDVAIGVIGTLDPTSIQAGQQCREGQVTLKASGAPDGGLYNWYESESADTSVADQHSASFVTPVLMKSKTYYVSVPNVLGCEGERKEVLAEIVQYDNAVIEFKDDSLKSNYAAGNQWSYNGTILAGSTGQSIAPEKSGTYSVSADIKGCKTSASREFVVTGLTNDEFTLTAFPNPVIGEVLIEIPGFKTTNCVKLINSLGDVMSTAEVHRDNGKMTAKFEMKNFPAGLYIVQVAGSDGIAELKLIKE